MVGLDSVPQEEPALQNADYDFRSTDITSSDQIKDLASHVQGQSNELQVLVNNAGIADPYLPEDPSEKLAHWHKVIQTNLTGMLIKCHIKHDLSSSLLKRSCRCISVVRGFATPHDSREIDYHTHVQHTS